MNKGICFFFGFEIEPEDRIEMIKDSGLDSIITIADPRFDYQNGSIEQQVALFRRHGMRLSSLHMRYKTSELPEFWQKSEIGDKMENNLIDDVRLAKKYGFTCVVVHLFGTFNKIGIKRLDNVLKVCEECDIPLAIENIDDQKTFVETMAHFKNHPYVKMCYDSGHHHIFDPDFDYFGKYGDKIICLHLHDNMGIKGILKNGTDDLDYHTINRYGNIDWDSLAGKLANVPNKLSLDYEILCRKIGAESAAEVLTIVYNQACKLEKMIEEKKAENQNGK